LIYGFGLPLWFLQTLLIFAMRDLEQYMLVFIWIFNKKYGWKKKKRLIQTYYEKSFEIPKGNHMV
jgi:hypothetical protein